MNALTTEHDQHSTKMETCFEMDVNTVWLIFIAAKIHYRKYIKSRCVQASTHTHSLTHSLTAQQGEAHQI